MLSSNLPFSVLPKLWAAQVVTVNIKQRRELAGEMLWEVNLYGSLGTFQQLGSES